MGEVRKAVENYIYEIWGKQTPIKAMVEKLRGFTGFQPRMRNRFLEGPHFPQGNKKNPILYGH
jgi:hypothetical protein